MKKKKSKILFSLFSLGVASIITIPFISCINVNKNLDKSLEKNINEQQINNIDLTKDNIDNLISILSTSFMELDVWNKNSKFQIQNYIIDYFSDIQINVEKVNFKFFDTKLSNYKFCNISIEFNNTNIHLSNDVINANIDSNVLKIDYDFQTKIWINNLDFSISELYLEQLYNKLQELYLSLYVNDSVDLNIGTNNKKNTIINSLNEILKLGKSYPLITDIIQSDSFYSIPKNGHKSISVELVFDNQPFPLMIKNSKYFKINGNRLIPNDFLETSVNSIKKNSNGKWDLSFVFPVIKQLIYDTGLKIDNKKNLDIILKDSKNEIQGMLEPYLNIKSVFVKDNKFKLGNNGKQFFTYVIDFGNQPIIKLDDSYKQFGFSYYNNRYLMLDNVSSNLNNVEINGNIINVTNLLDYFTSIFSEEVVKINNINTSNVILKNLVNEINEFLGDDYIKNIELISNSKTINSKTSKLEYQLRIIFNSRYQLEIDSSYVGDYQCTNNILYSGSFLTSIDANYNNISDIVDKNFKTLDIDGIKNDVLNHTMDQLNFLKQNIDYIQILLQKIMNNEKVYNFIINNSDIISNLISNIINQSIKRDLQSKDFFKSILEDRSLKEILNNNSAVNGLINIVRYFLPNEADAIISTINTIKILPINSIITTLQKLLVGKLPDNIIESLNDLKTLGLMSFIIEHDIDIFGLFPSNNFMNNILEILKITNVNHLKSVGIIDFILELLKTNNGINYVRSLIFDLLKINSNSSLGKILDSFIFNNASLNRDTLSGFFYVFANPINSQGQLVKYKDFFNSLGIDHQFNKAIYTNQHLNLDFNITFRFNMDLQFQINKIYDLFPNFTINLGSLKINKDFIVKNIPRKICIVSGDFVKYNLSIDDNVNYHIDQQPGQNCLSWQAMAHEKYEINMKRSCEKWYRETPKGALVGIAKVLSKYATGIFYHIWDVDLNFKPDNSILNKFKIPGYQYYSNDNGIVSIKNISNSEKERIKNDILSTVKDNWVPNSQYEYHSGLEWIKISQFYTTFNYDINSVIDKFIDLSKYNDKYFVRLNVHTLAKELKIGSISLPSIRMIEIKVFFPFFVNDGNGNFINHITITL